MLKIYVNISQMPKVIQVRNVPDDVYLEAKARAARAGLSLSDFLLQELAQSLAVPPVDVVLARIAGGSPGACRVSGRSGAGRTRAAVRVADAPVMVEILPTCARTD